MKPKNSLNWLSALALLASSSIGVLAEQSLQVPSAASTSKATQSTIPPAAAQGDSGKTRPSIKAEPPGDYVSPWLVDMAKLARARIDGGVLLIFVDSAGTFNLTADQIIYLRDLGVSNDVIAAMIQHDLELSSGMRAMPPTASPASSGVHLTFVHNDSPSESNPQTAAAMSTPATEPPPASQEPPLNLSPSTDFRPELGSARPAVTDSQRIPPTRTQAQSAEVTGSFSPVRKPYPVPLFDSIIVVRCESPTPNVVLIESLP